MRSSVAVIAAVVCGLWSGVAGAMTPEAEAVEIQMRLKQHFPAAEVGEFECGDSEDHVACHNLVSFPSFGINFLLTIENDGRPKAVMVMMAAPAMAAKGADETKEMTAAFAEASLAVMDIAENPLPVGKRLAFIIKAMKAGDDGVTKNGWTYSGGASVFTTFSAERQ